MSDAQFLRGQLRRGNDLADESTVRGQTMMNECVPWLEPGAETFTVRTRD
jgi:hypothetical protein